MAVVYKPAFSQESDVTAVERRPMSPPAPPEPFAIEVNGDSEPTTIIVKRGETTQIDVLVRPLIPGIEGNVYLQSLRPECGTSDLQLECAREGMTASISENSVNTSANLVVTINVAPDFQPGTYGYEIIAETMLKLPTQDTPAKVGNIHAFTIEVV
jgi:hypothetical protein